ncbi:MAG: hypothetical protein IH792_05865 [Thaumarchaeota archaeon]|nr:hypothetical protein [Nitrososphaerota archaeon]
MINNNHIILLLFSLSILLIFPINNSFADSGIISVDNYDVSYDIDGGTVVTIFLDPDFVDLMVFSDTIRDGTLEITIPRQLLDAKFDGTDDIFFILIDGFETYYLELESTGDSRTLIIPFFAGDTIFEILGTSVFDLGLTSQIQIPDWVRNNAGWWATGQIGDSDFVSGIEFLITEDIIAIPPTQSGQGTSQEIPGWIKNNAGWWADGLIEDVDFVSGIQYLISNGIMKV